MRHIMTAEKGNMKVQSIWTFFVLSPPSWVFFILLLDFILSLTSTFLGMDWHRRERDGIECSTEYPIQWNSTLILSFSHSFLLPFFFLLLLLLVLVLFLHFLIPHFPFLFFLFRLSPSVQRTKRIYIVESPRHSIGSPTSTSKKYKKRTRVPTNNDIDNAGIKIKLKKGEESGLEHRLFLFLFEFPYFSVYLQQREVSLSQFKIKDFRLWTWRTLKSIPNTNSWITLTFIFLISFFL